MFRFAPRQQLLSLAIAVAAAITPQAHAAKDKVQTIPVADLPRWEGDTTTLKWLNPRLFRSSVDGPAPDSRMGVERLPTVLHPYSLAMATQPGRPAPLVDGWEVEAVRPKTCLSSTLTLHHRPSGRKAQWVVRKHRAAGLIDAALNCADAPATTDHAVLLNSRYFAFLTSDGGWVFFDRVDARFLPLVILTEQGHHSDLYVTPEGRVLVDIDSSYDPATRTVTRGPSGVREVRLDGAPLEAPLTPAEVDEVATANEVARCWILRDSGRACKAE